MAVDADAVVIEANFACAALLGRAPRELRGSDLRACIVGGSLPAFLVFLAQAFGGTGRSSCEIELRGAGGPFAAHVEARADVARGECRLAVVDVSEQRRSAAVRESEQRFQVALANSPITVFEHDLELRYTWIRNPMLGLSPRAVIGRRNAEIMDAESATRLDALLRAVIADGESTRSEVAIGAGR